VSNESNPEWIIRGLIGAIKNDKRCGSGDVEKTFGPEKWSRCVKLSKDAGVGGGSEVGEKAGDGVEDRIDVGVWSGCRGWNWCCYWIEGWNMCCWLWSLCEFGVLKTGVQVGVFKLG
jgi:hypothetical protein